MKLFKLIFKNKFFLKMMLTYCLVIFLGLGSAFYFVTREMIDILVDETAVREKEIVQTVKAYSEERLRDTRRIFTRLYQPQFFDNNNSIVDYLNPIKEVRIDSENKLAVITTFLQNTINANNFIVDMYIVDYHDREVFFRSNIPGRSQSIDYYFFRPDFLRDGYINTDIVIAPAHIPYYLNVFGDNFPVISYSIYLFDRSFMRFDNPLGLAVVNVRADFFINAFANLYDFRGNIIITDGNGISLFDSRGNLTPGELFLFSDYTFNEIEQLKLNDNYMVNMVSSYDTGLIYINILERQMLLEETQAIRRNFITIIAVCIAASMLIGLLFAAMFSRRIKSLAHTMQDVEKGKLDTRVKVNSKDELGYLEHSFNTMCSKLDEYIKSVYVFELKTKTAELRALQAQINPHFLFNTLESIRITAQLNKDVQTAKMIHMLGSMLRWNINVTGVFVKLSEEIDYTNSYLELQKLRYDDPFNVLINVPHALQDFGVPKLILQPLVENTLQHGFSSDVTNGIIEISATQENDKLIITISDNGCGMDSDKLRDVIRELNKNLDDADSRSIGLSNVHQRLSILFGDDNGLQITGESGKGTTMQLTIPAISKEGMEKYVQSSNS